jgi:hypothetical protein
MQTAAVEKNIPLLEEILGEWKAAIGVDFAGYRNHVYRMVNFCFAQRDFPAEEREKIVIAGCFHDLGIWSHATFDYLPPSIELAKEYLQKNRRESIGAEIGLMIEMHHKLGKYETAQNPLVEVFRKGDLVDFSLGIVKCGLPKSYIKSVKKQFPNAGFHKCLARLAGKWFLRHPLNPVPVLKW